MIYQYSDGSNNTYIITNNSIKYLPVKAEFSSSGVYDGGTEKTENISPQEFKQIRKLIDAAVNNEKIQTESRVMMSGLIKITTNGESKKYIIIPGSPQQTEIESLLKKIIDSH